MEEQLKSDFDKVIKSLELSNENIESRKKNLNEFIKNGFPNKKKEEWKFFDLSQIINSNIKNLSFFNNCLVPTKNEESIDIKSFEHNKIIIINGFVSTVNFDHEEKKKVEVEQDLNFIENNEKPNILISLNDALLSSYTKITVKKNYSLNKPLIIYNITNSKLNATAVNFRSDIVLEEGSSLKLVTMSSDNSKDNFINIFKLGPEVSFKGSPTVSPTTTAL